MCVVSMIGDHYNDKWKDLFPNIPISPTPPYNQRSIFPEITREEFNQLKKEVEDLKELLKRAKIYDEKNNEPNCEIETKMAFLREVAKFVGIDLDEVLKPKLNG